MFIRLGLSEYLKVVPFRTFKHFCINNRLSRPFTARGWDIRFPRVGPTKVYGLQDLLFWGNLEMRAGYTKVAMRMNIHD